MMGSGKVASQQRKLDDLNRQFQALPPPPPGPTAAQQKLAGEQSARVSVLTTALSSRVSWDRVFREFSLILPEDVWLTSLSAKSPISPATNASSTGGSTVPSMFTIQGRTYSHDGVARLLSRLQVVPDLTNVQLISSTRSKVGNQPVVEFTIAADIAVGRSFGLVKQLKGLPPERADRDDRRRRAPVRARRLVPARASPRAAS